MALTRKFLKALGIEDDKVDQIIEAHAETVDGLKADITKYKADAESLPDVQKKLDDANAELETTKKDSWKVKYDDLKKEYEGYKTETTGKETKNAKEQAYRALLKAANIDEKRIDAIIKVTKLDDYELKDGKFVKADEMAAAIKTEWADFVATTQTKGQKVDTPPANPGSPVTKEQFGKMSLRERTKLKQDDPEAYKTLTTKG
jgi:hypothetical protein